MSPMIKGGNGGRFDDANASATEDNATIAEQDENAAAIATKITPNLISIAKIEELT